MTKPFNEDLIRLASKQGSVVDIASQLPSHLRSKKNSTSLKMHGAVSIDAGETERLNTLAEGEIRSGLGSRAILKESGDDKASEFRRDILHNQNNRDIKLLTLKLQPTHDEMGLNLLGVSASALKPPITLSNSSRLD